MRHFMSGLALMVALGGVLLGDGRAEAQAVAFAPTIGTLPDGVQLNTIPVVSADRRYVRVSVGAGFQTINGFQSFGIPGAVAGGGGGTFGGAGGGFGGTGVGGGVAGGGFRSVTTGMDGTISNGMGQSGYVANMGGYGWDQSAGYDYGYVDYGMGYVPPARKSRKTKTTQAKAAPAKTQPAAGTEPVVTSKKKSARS